MDERALPFSEYRCPQKRTSHACRHLSGFRNCFKPDLRWCGNLLSSSMQRDIFSLKRTWCESGNAEAVGVRAFSCRWSHHMAEMMNTLERMPETGWSVQMKVWSCFFCLKSVYLQGISRSCREHGERRSRTLLRMALPDCGLSAGDCTVSQL